MDTGLPFESWALIMVAVGLGLLLELAFLRAQRGRRPPPPGGEGVGGDGTRESW